MRLPQPPGPCTTAEPGSPLLALQAVLQLHNPGLQLHHQPLFAGPVGTFQMDNPALQVLVLESDRETMKGCVSATLCRTEYRWSRQVGVTVMNLLSTPRWVAPGKPGMFPGEGLAPQPWQAKRTDSVIFPYNLRHGLGLLDVTRPWPFIKLLAREIGSFTNASWQSQ